VSGVINDTFGDFGRGVNSGLVGGVGHVFNGNVSPFIDKVSGGFFDCNVNGSATFNGSDEDTSTTNFSKWWAWGTYDHDKLMQNMAFLFGPGYTAVDSANGGWRVGIKFQSRIRLMAIRCMGVKTNARQRWLGVYKQDDASGTNRAYVPARHATSLTGARRTTTDLTIFGTASPFFELVSSDDQHYFTYEPVVSQYWTFSFGNSVHNAGNTNAGAAGLQIFGSIALPPNEFTRFTQRGN